MKRRSAESSVQSAQWEKREIGQRMGVHEALEGAKEAGIYKQ
jgi:hypothetical protein